ncbi:hypothetical protein LQF12_00160 [Ruania suaedae]|uniref:hypothetical protein n=1 Tax=Ruania suaedae TaxID=2897774 RepID=UPI001E3689B4|nr:hypothetical protein [Ruania suaedae]UFU03061.1 hypothetical protein LQF12_00160 [Ruania suaedae]
MSTSPDPAQRAPRSRERLLPLWVYAPAGLVTVVIGLLPWLRSGPRLPLQNLWAARTAPEQMPLALLPLNQYYLVPLLGMLVTAGLLSGLLARLEPRQRRRRSTLLTAVGMFAGFLAVGVPSGLVLAGGLEESARATVYLAGVLTWTILSAFAAVLVLGLVGRGRRGAVAIAMSLAAAPVGAWAQYLFAADPSTAAPGLVETVGSLRWLPAVLVGLALAWCGIRLSAKIAAWVLSLVVLWVMPAVLTAISYVAGYRNAEVGERIGSGLDVLAAAMAPGTAGPPVLVALAIGVVGAVAVALWRWWRTRTARNRSEQNRENGLDGAS